MEGSGSQRALRHDKIEIEIEVEMKLRRRCQGKKALPLGCPKTLDPKGRPLERSDAGPGGGAVPLQTPVEIEQATPQLDRAGP